jgi:phosphohistidine phosphatase
MTVRTLVLLRHAKAKRPDGVSDVERALTPRGHADAGAAGAWLAAQGLRPDLVLCSPARRARETCHAVRVALGGDLAVRYDPWLYDAGAREILDAVRATDGDVTVLLVVGHNPAVSTLSAKLDPAGDADDGLRTAGLAVHRLEGAWSDFGPRRAPVALAHTARA